MNSLPLILGAIVAAWAMLSLLGFERARKIAALPAKPEPPPKQPTSVASKIPTPRIPSPSSSAAKPIAARPAGDGKPIR